MDFSHLHELIRLFPISSTFGNKHLKHVLLSTEDESLHKVCFRQNLRQKLGTEWPKQHKENRADKRACFTEDRNQVVQRMLHGNSQWWCVNFHVTILVHFTEQRTSIILSWRPSLNCLFGWSVVRIIVSFCFV